MAEIKFPTEFVDLPSKGKLYPKDSPLYSGKVELRYMTARDEDILTNQTYIEKGTVVDKLLQNLIVDKNIDYSQLLIGDKNALLIAARALGYGAKYEFDYNGHKETVDLTQLPVKELDSLVENATENSFEYTLPTSGVKILFKLLTHADETLIEQELKGMRRINKENSYELSTRIKYMIISVNGEVDRAAIRNFVDKQMLARDARAFRKYVNKIQPDIDMRFYPEDGPEDGAQIPISVSFLWPDVEV